MVGLNYYVYEPKNNEAIGFCASPDYNSFSCAVSTYDAEFGEFGPIKSYRTSDIKSFSPWNVEPLDEWTAGVEGWDGEVEFDWETYEYKLVAGKSISEKFAGYGDMYFTTFNIQKDDKFYNDDFQSVRLMEYRFTGAFESLAVSLVASVGMLALTM